MSNNAKKKAEAVAQVLFTGNPKPLVDATEKRPQTGNGKATFKTASAAANAAREARDEARDAAALAEKFMLSAKRFNELIDKNVERDIKNAKELLEGLEKHDRRMRFYCIMSWAAAGAVIGALIFS
jgi:hypothetical protein